MDSSSDNKSSDIKMKYDTLNVSGFVIMTEGETDQKRLVITIPDDVNDLTLDVKTKGRILGINTFIDTSA